MITRDFIYYLVSHGRQIVKHDSHSEFRPNIAILSELITWPCDFEDGKCKGDRPSGKCCCHDCVDFLGHFSNKWPNLLRTLEKYAKLFTAKNGFWRPGKGCILPRHMRSLTCAFYICGKKQKEFKNLNPPDLEVLRRAVGKYTEASYLYGGRGGSYEKDFIKTETDLNKAVDKFMWKRKLYYDVFNRRLLKILKRKKTPNGYELEVGSIGRVVQIGKGRA